MTDSPNHLLTPSKPEPGSRPVDDLIDSLLHEHFDHETPPDLTKAVAAEWRRDRGRAAEHRVMTATATASPTGRQRWLVAAMVLLGLGVVAGTGFARAEPEASTVATRAGSQPQEPTPEAEVPAVAAPQGNQDPQPTTKSLPGAIELRVVDHLGGPVQDFDLRIARVIERTPPAPGKIATRVPGKDRHVTPRDFVDDYLRVADLPPGSYVAIITALPRVMTVSPTFTVAETASPNRLVVTLARGATITGVVRDVEGQPVANAEIQTGSARGTPKALGAFQQIVGQHLAKLHTITTVKTNDQGRFRLQRITPGRYSLVITHGDYCVEKIRELQVVDGAQKLPAIQLERGVVVHGSATLAGKPTPGLRIQLSRQDTPADAPKAKPAPQLHQVVTDADGNFQFLQPLRPGAYVLSGSQVTAKANPFQMLLQLRDTQHQVVLKPGQKKARFDVAIPAHR